MRAPSNPARLDIDDELYFRPAATNSCVPGQSDNAIPRHLADCNTVVRNLSCTPDQAAWPIHPQSHEVYKQKQLFPGYTTDVNDG
jgi:hypothetical protein